jgi:hypothetical protein
MLLDAFHLVGKPACRIEAIHTANHSNVTQAVRDYPKTCRDDRVVVFVTHAALQLTDLSAYSDRALIIDEVPSVWFTDSLKTPATWTLFRDNFTLEPIPDTGWSRIRMKAGAATVAAFQEDTLGNDIAVLATRIKDRVSGVYAKLQAWEDTAADGVNSTPWSWFAIWSPESLWIFRKVIMLGNSIPATLTFKLWSEWYGASYVRWNEIRLSSIRVFKPRRITIEYYSQRRATRRYFEEHPGVLDLVAQHINQACDRDNHFWSANRNLQEAGFRLEGERIGPRASGRNDLMGYTEGSFIYAAKPRPDELEILNILGITEPMVVRAREHEDIIQMFGRCSIRDPDDERDIRFRVFSKDQAEVIADHYRDSPHRFELRHIDLHLPGQTLGDPGRPMVGSRAMTPAERKAAQRWRARMVAAGVSDIRDLPRADGLSDDLIAFINASHRMTTSRAVSA